MPLADAFNLSNTDDVIMPNSDLSTSPRTVLFLAPDFPLMAYASAVEPLQTANVLTGRRLYAWPQMTAARAGVRGGFP